MSLREEKNIDRIEVVENGTLQIREANLIFRGEERIAKTYHRYFLEPGADLSNQPDNVVAIANAAWTPEIVSAYNSLLEMHKERI